MAQATCPGCGAPIEFKIGGPSSVVCGSCSSVASRTDRGIEDLGKVADVVFSDVALAVYDRGNFRGRTYEISGRVMFRHPAGGSWEEYLAHFSDGTVGTIAEAQGRWTITMRVDAHPPPFQALHVGDSVHLGLHGDYVVDEMNVGILIGGEGEMPFAAAPGSGRSFVDVSGAGGARGSIDYGDGTSAPVVYVGTACSLEELGLERRGLDRGEKVMTTSVTCPSCGAPVPICAPGVTERIACRFCGAVSDLGKNVVLSEQTRREPWIPLGSQGTLEGVQWIVIGYVERSSEAEGEMFGWSEYLLYEPSQGYRWLVYDEGAFLFGTPLVAGDLDLRGYPHVVRYSAATFKLRNSGIATVDYVLGELYWKVTIGESVTTEDFESSGYVLSSERSDGEQNWTFSKPLDAAVVRSAFGLSGPSGRPMRIEDIKTIDGDQADDSDTPRWAKLVLIAVALFFLFVLMNGRGSSSDDSSGFRSTGGVVGVGGFGGK